MNTLGRSQSADEVAHATVGTTTIFSILPLPRPPLNDEHLLAHDNTPVTPSETQTHVPHWPIRRLMAFFGYGGSTLNAHRALVSLYISLTLYIIQFVIIITVLIISATTKSPVEPSLNEWQACSKPLGILGALWVARTLFAATFTYWRWRRGPQAGRANFFPILGREGSNARDVELANPSILQTGTAQSNPPVLADSAMPRSLEPKTNFFTWLPLLSSLTTLAWFLTAHIFEYASIDTCRHSSPHLFWLVFGILSIVYLIVLEVVVIGLTAFIIAPLLFLFWNLALFILGKHPLQNQSDIGKLPKSVVDRIPLVIYIPSPPEEETTYNHGAKTATSPVLHLPATPPEASAVKPKHRFKFLRSLARKGGNDSAKDKNQPDGSVAEQGRGTWESDWEPSEYPFVRLDSNRATCSICLTDFEEPPRRNADAQNDTIASGSEEQESAASTVNDAERSENGLVTQVSTETMTNTEHEAELRLVEAGEGSQPLRLLTCGHTFHKTCIDPWLTDVSGICAVCRRTAKLPENKKAVLVT